MKRLWRQFQDINLGKLALAFGARGLSPLLSFLLLWLVGQSLGINDYGLYVFLFSLGSALGLAMVLGQSIFTIKHFRAQDHVAGRTNLSVLRHNAKYLALGQIVLLTAGAGFFVFSDLIPEPYSHIHWACLFASAFSLGEYFVSYFRMTDRFALSLIPRETFWRGSSAAAIALCLFLGVALTGEQALLIVTGLLFAAVGFQLLHFIQTEGSAWFSSCNEDLTADNRRHWGRETTFFSASLLLAAAGGYSATILIGLVIGLAEAAIYFVTLRIAMLLSLPNTVLDTILLPRLSGCLQSRDQEGAQKLLRSYSASCFCLTLLGYAGLLALGGLVLWLFDPSFVTAKPVLLMLAAAVLLDAFVGPASQLLMIAGFERRILALQAGLLALELILMAVLGSFFGIFGVAMAVLTGSLIDNVLLTLWVMRQLGLDPMATSLLRPVRLGGRKIAAQTADHPLSSPDEPQEKSHTTAQ